MATKSKKSSRSTRSSKGSSPNHDERLTPPGILICGSYLGSLLNNVYYFVSRVRIALNYFKNPQFLTFHCYLQLENIF